MSYILILFIYGSSVGALSPFSTVTSTQQIGPFETVAECEILRKDAVTKIESDASVKAKGVCIQATLSVAKEVKLYDDNHP